MSLPLPTTRPGYPTVLGNYILTDWDLPCQQAYGHPCGVFTSVSGSAPSRIFNIEWRARLIGSNHEVVDFEIRLHEGTGLIDFVYGFGMWFSSPPVGVQDGATQFTSYACYSGNIHQDLAIRWTPIIPPPCGPTNTPTPTVTPTPTQCTTTYTYTVTAGMPITATNLVPGSQCPLCIVPIDLPFPFSFYGQIYNTANLTPKGNLQFVTTANPN